MDISQSIDRAFRLSRRVIRDDNKDQPLSFGHLFFKNWFLIDRKQACLFIFKKNYKITNIQFAELLSLLRVHSKSEVFDPVETLHFVSTDDFRSMVQQMSEAFKLNDSNARKKVARLYKAVFERTVAIERRFGCCEVYLPPGLQVDLASMCAASGYIDSCGYNVFVRKAYKATMRAFMRELGEYTKPHGNESRAKLYFAAYSHEDFDEYDAEERRALRNGLDDLKIALEKFYMGGDRIVDVLRSIKAEYGGTFEVARAGQSGRQRKREVDKLNAVDPQRTLWLFIDRVVSSRHDRTQTEGGLGEARQPGDTTYFLCFDQRYVNENPYHIFDENKPGWEDHTTIPHTLMGAMINLTRPWWPSRSRGKVVICDPFAGSGTTLFEAAKFTRVDAVGSDRSVMSGLMYSDNSKFFKASPKKLGEWLETLTEVKDSSHELYSSVIETIRKQSNNKKYSPEALTKVLLKEPTFVRRLVLYLLLRAVRRYSTGFIRSESESENPGLLWRAFRKENEAFVAQLRLLLAVRRRDNQRPGKDVNVGFAVAKGVFADSCIPYSKRATVLKRNLNQLPPNSCDVIVADPPYGFNTTEEIKRLAELYSTMVDKMILALKKKEGGQIVIAVPDWSHTGRQLPLFALKDLLTQQLIIAAKSRRKMVKACPNLAAPHLSVSPYYWESERALRRAILHFVIRPATLATTK